MTTRTIIIRNLCSYPVRVFIGLDQETGFERFHTLKPLGKFGPIEIDNFTDEHLQINPNVKIIETL